MAKRHFVLPDTQVRPDTPTDHLDWIAEAICEYRPDVIVHLGDHWDHESLCRYHEPGSAEAEGKRYKMDVEAGNDAFLRLDRPISKEVRKSRSWRPRKVFLVGNHEVRADTAAQNNPKFLGHVGSENCDTLDWERHSFLEIVRIDSVLYSHFFANTHSGRPIGGTIQNRLNKIGQSFVQGHEQGLDIGTKLWASGITSWGIKAGSCYLHREEYRGNQGQRHWVGCLVLNEVRGNGEMSPMDLTLSYLCQKYAGSSLMTYMNRKYRGCDWRHLADVPQQYLEAA